MEFIIPISLKIEHEKLHSELANAIKEGGKIGESGKSIAKILHPHFLKEEEFAMPPLGLLSYLVEDNKNIIEMKDVISMTDKLKKELPRMLEEHKMIVESLDNFIVISKEEKKIEYIDFADKLKIHAQNEEEVLYPAAVLVGEYIKLKIKT